MGFGRIDEKELPLTTRWWAVLHAGVSYSGLVHFKFTELVISVGLVAGGVSVPPKLVLLRKR